MREVRFHHKITPKILTLVAVALLTASVPALAQETVMSELSGIRQQAVEAYNQRSWQQAVTAADRYMQQLEQNDLPRAGSDFALVSFIGGHSRFELWKQDPEAFSYDFEQDVLGAMKDSLKILQDDPFFKYNVLGSAYYEKLSHERFNDVELENAASWHLQRALMIRAEELENEPRDTEKYQAFAKYVLHYINRCFKMARYSEVPQIYLIRIREACRLGFGTDFDDRFAQLYKVVGFDDGNVRAGVLWQTGLDLMNSEEPEPAKVLDTFAEAARATQGVRQRAEIYRQMADYCSRQDDHGYKLKAVEYGRMAFKLDPSSDDIQMQYGTSLHVVSYAHYSSGRYREALKIAREATSFQWEGDELAYFDLSRAQANFGNKIDAITHAEKAYKRALKKYSGEELQPFRQNYANILRQFGLAKKAEQLEQEDQGS